MAGRGRVGGDLPRLQHVHEWLQNLLGLLLDSGLATRQRRVECAGALDTAKVKYKKKTKAVCRFRGREMK